MAVAEIDLLTQGIESRAIVPPSNKPGETSNLEQAVWFNINNLLGQKPRFAANSPVTQYIQQRFDNLFGKSKAEVIVVHNDEFNGFATPGYVVVNDGLLKKLDCQEELDAFLAHEGTHLFQHHVEDSQKRKSVPARVGNTRVHETESDLRPVELLDRKEISAHGFITLFEKMEAHASESKKKSDINIPVDSPTHGSLLDRRLNLSQLAWLIDLRNISRDKTELLIQAKDLEDFEKDEDLMNKYEQLDDLSKRQLIQRQINKVSEDDKAQTLTQEDAENRLADLFTKQYELYAKAAPELSKDELEQLTLSCIYGSYELKSLFRGELNGEKVNLQDILKFITDEESVKRIFELMKHQANFELGINFEKGQKTLHAGTEGSKVIGDKVLRAFLDKQDFLNIKQFVSLVEQIPEDIRDNGYFYEQLIEVIYNKKLDNMAVFQELVGSVVDKSIDFATFYNYWEFYATGEDSEVFNANGAGQRFPEGYDNSYDPDEDDDFDPLYQGRAINNDIARSKTIISGMIDYGRNLRTNLAITIEDPIELAEFVKFSGDFIDESSESYRNHIEFVIEQAPLAEFMNKIKDWEINNSKPISEMPFAKFIADVIDLREHQSDGIDFRASVGNISELNDRLKIFSLLLPKDEYLEFLDNELPRYGNEYRDNLDQYRKLAQQVMQARKDLIKEGFGHVELIDKKDIGEVDYLVEAIKYFGLTEASRKKDPKLLVSLLKNYPIYNVRVSPSAEFSDPDVSSQHAWDNLVTLAIETKVQRSENEQLEIMFALGCFAESNQVLLQVPTKSIETLVRNLSFEQGKKLLFKDYAHLPRHLFSAAFNVLVEEKAHSIEDLEYLESQAFSQLDAFSKNEEEIGKAAMVDAYLIEPGKSFDEKTTEVGIQRNTLRGVKSGELLDALLATRESDEKLKRYIFNRWWGAQRYGSEESKRQFKIEDYTVYKNHEAQLNYWYRQLPSRNQYRPYNEILRDTLLSNDVMKYAVLRRILTGNDGVLSSDQGKDMLRDAFLDKWVSYDGEEGAAESMTRELVGSLISVGTQDELYDRMNGILTDLILLPSKKEFPVTMLAKETARDVLLHMQKQGVYTNPTVKDLTGMAKKVYLLMNGGESEFTSDIAARELLYHTESSHDLGSLEKFTPWDLAIMIGQKSGAFGTRMLQLAGQYFELSPEDQERLSNTYDQNKGQSRLQAYRVLRREAETSTEIANLLENIEVFGNRIGGGSLVTVYEVFLKDGSREAVSVRNPNIEYHLDNTIDLAKRAIDEAQNMKPDNLDYSLMDVLVDDVKEWIEDELHDPEFEQKDILFKLQNQGWTDGDNNYSILVPDSKLTGTRWVRRDQYVEGKNLTSLTITEEASNIEDGTINAEDYKQVTSLLVKNYFHQITETGLVHSDIHPGNFRVTADNKQLAVFDRYNLLKLDEGEQELVSGLIGAFMFGGVNGVQEHMFDYLLSLEVNQNLNKNPDALRATVAELGQSENMEQAIIKNIVSLKREGVKIPTKISLIAKNLQTLNRMSQKAGFNSITDALLAA